MLHGTPSVSPGSTATDDAAGQPPTAVTPVRGGLRPSRLTFIGRMTAGPRVCSCRLAALERGLKVRPHPPRGSHAYPVATGETWGLAASQAGGVLIDTFLYMAEAVHTDSCSGLGHKLDTSYTDRQGCTLVLGVGVTGVLLWLLHCGSFWCSHCLTALR